MYQFAPVDLQSALDSAIAERNDRQARRRHFLTALRQRGLVPNQDDQAGRFQLGQLLRFAPGPSPAAALASDDDVDNFLDYHAQLAMGGHRWGGATPGNAWNMGGRSNQDFRVEDPKDEEGGEIYGLTLETLAAASTGGTDTTTWSSNQQIRDARLWLWTAKGLVTHITELKVNDNAIKLGPGGFLPAECCDFGANDSPENRGLYVGDINKLDLTVYVASNPTDVIWGLMVDGDWEDKHARRPFSVLRRLRRR